MGLLEDIQKKIKEWENRWKKIDSILDNTNATIIQTKEAVEQMKDTFTDISSLVKTMSEDYERIKTKLDTLETKIKKNWWMRIFGLGD